MLSVSVAVLLLVLQKKRYWNEVRALHRLGGYMDEVVAARVGSSSLLIDYSSDTMVFSRQ